MENKSYHSRPLVCIFDSGIGGLNLLAECYRRIPQADYMYFADNFNVPYGNLPAAKINSLVFDIFRQISSFHPSAAVVACNTVTAECILSLRAKYAFPILGMEPALKQAWKRGGKYLVLATEATVNSAGFAKLIKAYGSMAEVCALKDLARRIEEGLAHGERIEPELPSGNYSSVVLGCTHYIFIKKFIKEKYNCEVYDGISGTADHLRAVLGISDHICEKPPEVAFKCGDFAKNKAIFEQLKQNNN